MSSAQDEFDRLIQANRDSSRTHPEDRDQSDSDSPANNNDAAAEDNYELSDADSDYGDHIKREDGNMVSRTAAAYTVPTTVFEANTGPKGVIADAQSFERARKKSFRRTLLSAAGLDSNSRLFGGNSSSNNNNITQHSRQTSSSPPSDEEDDFMRRWRESRMQELQERSQRRPSPSKRVYGRVDTVDAEGYLNAIERVASDTVVVVCIYDPMVCPSSPHLTSFSVTNKNYILTNEDSHPSAPKSKTQLKSSRANTSPRASSSCTTRLRK